MPPLSHGKSKRQGREDSISAQRGEKEAGEDRAVAKRWGQGREDVDEYGCLRVTVLKYKLQFS